MPFDESQYQRVPCETQPQTFKLAEGQEADITVTLRDSNGNALDVSSLAPQLSQQDNESSSSDAGGGFEVKLAAQIVLNASTKEFEITGEITSAENGTVTFTISEEQSCRPGLLVGSIGVFYNDKLRHHQRVYLHFEPTAFSTSTTGPLSITEVRMELMDTCPDANYLIDELEFTDAEIMHAMRKVVGIFNEMNPPVGGWDYEQFPYPANLCNGVAGYLLRMIAHRYMRNRLDYSAGGVTVRDQERYRDYISIGNQKMAEFKEWAQEKKISININGGYGSIGPSAYGRGRYRNG